MTARKAPTRLAIAGGAPAGLSAAMSAARAGLPCVLFEKGRIGQGIQCAEGIFDPAGLIPLDREVIRTRIRRAVLRVRGQEFSFGLGARNRFYVIDRSAWQEALGRRVRAAGVEVREQSPVRPEALLADFDAVIDARGAFAYYDHWEELPRRPGFGVQWTLAGDFSRWRDAIDVEIFAEQPAYFWIFPKGTTAAHVGFGCLDKPASAYWDILEGYLRRQGIDGCERVRKIGGFLVGVAPVDAIEGRLIRVGDAGGFASALHGGGIDAAWLTGRLAVESIARQDPAHFYRELNRKLGFLRQVEQKVFDKWQAEGAVALAKAGRLLAENGPLLRASVRFVTSGILGAAVRRVFQQAVPREFYFPPTEFGTRKSVIGPD